MVRHMTAVKIVAIERAHKSHWQRHQFHHPKMVLLSDVLQKACKTPHALYSYKKQLVIKYDKPCNLKSGVKRMNEN
jgi:hypothetical protein